MALIKYKPTSPGTRGVIKVDRSHLHKGDPYLPLTVHQNKTGARNHSGRITTRHQGGGSRQKYRIIDFKRDKDGVAGVQVVNEPGKTRRFGKTLGRTQDWKKAYVSLVAGQTIDYEARAKA